MNNFRPINWIANEMEKKFLKTQITKTNSGIQKISV